MRGVVTVDDADRFQFHACNALSLSEDDTRRKCLQVLDSEVAFATIGKGRKGKTSLITFSQVYASTKEK